MYYNYKRIELTLQCVVETGMPSADAPRTVNALINSMQNPLHGVIVVISSPIATISFAPHVHRPAVIPRPPNNNRNHGVPVFGSTLYVWFYLQWCPDSPYLHGRPTLVSERYLLPHAKIWHI